MRFFFLLFVAYLLLAEWGWTPGSHFGAEAFCQIPDTGNQTLCEVTGTPSPIWCEAANPFSVVFNLSDSIYPNVPCLGIMCQTAVDPTEGNPFHCEGDGDNPYDQCYDIVSINTFETAVENLPYMMPQWLGLASNSTKCSDQPDACLPFVFVVLGLFDGSFVGNVINVISGDGPSGSEYLETFRRQKAMIRLQLFDGPITLQSSLGIGTKSVFTMSDGKTVKIMSMDTTDYLTTEAFTVYGTKTPFMEPKGDIADINTFWDYETGSWMVAVLVTNMTAPDSNAVAFYQVPQWNGVFDPLRFTGNFNYYQSLMNCNVSQLQDCLCQPSVCGLSPFVVWKIPSPTPPVSIQSFVQHMNLLPTSLVNDQTAENRTLIAVTTSEQVSVFQFTKADYMNETTLPYPYPNATSVVFTAGPEETIADASIFEEYFRTFDSSTTQCSQVLRNAAPNGPLVLVVGINPSSSSLPSYSRVVRLTEFGFMGAGGGVISPSNPAGLTAAGQFQCNRSVEWYDVATASCQERLEMIIPSPGPIKSILTRFRSMLDGSEQLSSFEQLTSCPACTLQGTSQAAQQAYMTCLNTFNCQCSFAKPLQQLQTELNALDAGPLLTLMKMPSPAQMFKEALQTFLQHVIFVHYQDVHHDGVHIVSMQEQLCSSEPEWITSDDRKVEYIGSVNNMDVANNSLHLFVSMTRSRWEMEGRMRFYNICTALSDRENIYPPPPDLNANWDKYDAFLQPYAESCSTFPPQKPNHNDFAAYASSCMPGVYCPSVNRMKMLPNPNTPSLQPGFFTRRSIEGQFCNSGYFCMQGNQQQCPAGFYCPQPGMGLPLPCSASPFHNSTCFHNRPSLQPGLTAPVPCEDGSICPVSYFPGLPAPPGRFVASGSRLEILDCAEGDWCALGRYNSSDIPGVACGSACDLQSPANTFTSSPFDMIPFLCIPSNTDNGAALYCPPGSTTRSLCPAGSQCLMPNVSEPCLKQGEYCPEGSFFPVECPGGFFCKTSSAKDICPSHYFCPVGSVSPTPCGIFTICHEGTASQSQNIAVPLVIVLTFVAGIIAWRVFLHYRDRERRRREDQRKVGGGSVDLEMTAEKKTAAMIPPKSFRMDFSFVKLGLKLKGTEKVVLAGVTGRIRSGHVTAVMGPSGAGKTTFLSTLCGKASYGVTTGDICINGKPESISTFKKIVGFVPQEDVMHRNLSVKENLMFSAFTRLPKSMPRTKKQEFVNTVIEVLQMQDIRHSLIGDETQRGVSGGQRKRVNIGLELVADPTVLFLDEPTSGLDSASSKAVCGALRDIASLGLTVVTVIHQPSYEIFRMFHDVLLLGKGGRTVYLGPSEAALAYFESLGFPCPPHINPPDFFMDVIAGEIPNTKNPDFEKDDLFACWEKHLHEQGLDTMAEVPFSESVEASSSASPPDPMDAAEKGRANLLQEGKAWKRQTAGFLDQCLFCCVRAMVQLTRNWAAFYFDIGLVLLSGLFLGLVYFQQVYQGPLPPDLFSNCALCSSNSTSSGAVNPCAMPRQDPIAGESAISTLSLGLAGVAASLRIFGAEKIVFWREASTGSSTLAYFLGKNIAHLPVTFLAPLLFQLLFYQMVTPRAPFILDYILFLGVYWTACGYGYLISIVVPPSQAQLAGVLSVLFNMMFSGQNPRFSQLRELLGGTLIAPTYISYIRWAQEAFYITEVTEYKTIYNVEGGLQYFGYDLDNGPLAFAMVFLIGLFVRVLAFLALLLLDRDKKV